MTCYSDLPLDSIIWWHNHTSPDFCKFYNSCTANSPFADSTYNTAGNGTIHQLILPLDGAVNGVYSCGIIHPVTGNSVVQQQNITFYSKPHI